MIRRVFLVVTLVLLPFWRANPALAEPAENILTFAGDIWCPVNCEADADHPGFAVDLLKQIYEPLGYKINYVVMPWARAVEEANTGQINGVLGALKDDAPKLLFPREPIATISDDIYVLSSNPIVYNGLQSLKGQSVGIIDGYSYSPEITAFLAENMPTPGAVQSVSGDDAIEQNIRKLRAGRITAIFESAITMEYTLSQMHLSEQIKHLGGVLSGKIYIAFAPNSLQSPTLRRQFDQSFARLRRDGTLARIYDVYGVSP